MIDIKKLREDPTPYKETAKKKFQDPTVIDSVLELDAKWRQIKKDIDNKRSERNAVSKEISSLKKEGKDASSALEKAKSIPQDIKSLEEQEQKVKEERDTLLRKVSNIIHVSVPLGKTDEDNVELSRHGPKPIKKEIKPHQVIAEELGVADFESSATTSGTGFYYIEGELALLNQALIRYGIDMMYNKGFRYVETPLMLRSHVVNNVVYLDDQEYQIYKIILLDISKII